MNVHDQPQHGFGAIDGTVIVAYVLGMLAVGWYFSRKTKTTDDYLLGGRRMRSSAVGLSLFASLMSAVSFLANPGEAICHGPMYLASIAALPIIYPIVGYLIIPFIMRLPITSAYELLETRLGIGGRLLGSSIFLVTRITWMGLIVYLVADKVVVPLMGWPAEFSPYVSVVLALVTVTYTSMGGIRAVVLTDVIQTLILIAGAIMVIVVVSVRMGGVGAWWPTEWAPNWDVQPLFSFDPHVRVTLMWSILASIVSWLTMVGSDQMAIQRYLATRDAKAARRVLAVTACTEVIMQTLYVMVGFALLALFLSNPHLLPAGQSPYTNADGLLPYFIMSFLPAGLAGLIISALLAAAMSSLSSGVNSACAVLSADFIDRFRKTKAGEARRLRTARLLSLLVGVGVVIVSLLIRQVPGNLFAVANKTVNLLPVPLFGLFFMAMFVRFATGFGAIFGTVYGFVVAFVIAYWDLMTNRPGLSFQWIPVMSLLACIGAGVLLSMVPVRGKDLRTRVLYAIPASLPLAAFLWWVLVVMRVPGN